MNFFTPECLKLHNEDDQLYFQVGLSNLEISEKNENELTALVYDTEDGDEYRASLEKCDCKYFKDHQLPCRHMYRAANAFSLFKTSKNATSKKLIADFSIGYADGWKFIVRPCNYLALDIRQLPPAKSSIDKRPTLVQGKYYNFVTGSLFYDNMAAYNKKWGDALKEINHSIQITESTPTNLDYEVVLKDNILTRITLINYGTVKFKLWSANDKFVGEFTCKQNEFLEILRSGDMSCAKAVIS